MNVTIVFALVALAFAALCFVQNVAQKRRQSGEDKVLKGYFLLGLSGLLSHVAAADGHVTDDETAMARKFFEGMDLTDAERAMCIGNFITARQGEMTARDHARRFLAYATPQACSFLYGLLWQLSGADGKTDSNEEKLLGEIALYLGLGEKAFEKYRGGYRPHVSIEALRAAGVPQSMLTLA